MMKQINNGFAEYYYLLEDGRLYDAKADKIKEPNKEHIYTMRTVENKKKRVALKTIYRLVYNKIYCIDNITDIDDEVWKEIDHTNGLYLISSKGRIKSLQGYEAIILKSFNNNGYCRADIVSEGKRQSKLVHRLVAAAFLPFPENIDMQLHHVDFNKCNNAADNLVWLTPAAHAALHKDHKEGDN